MTTMTRCAVSVAVVLLAAFYPGPTQATTITLRDGLTVFDNVYNGTQDTHVERNQSGTAAGEEDFNYGGRTEVLVFNRSVRDSVGLIRFDLTPLLGEVVSINSAQLVLTRFGNATVDVQLQQIAASEAEWVEGTVNGLAQTGSSTWNEKRAGILNWAGTFDGNTKIVETAGILDTQSYAPTVTFDIADASFMNQWLIDPSSNAGFLLNDISGSPEAFPNDGFLSSEFATAALRPTLILDVKLVPEPSTAMLTALGLLGMCRFRRGRRTRRAGEKWPQRATPST